MKLAQRFWTRRFFFVNIFLQFRNHLPLEKGGALHLNKLESPSSKNALCQVYLQLAQRFWRKRFKYCVNVFSLFRYYLPLKKVESSSPKDALCHVWLNWPSGSGKKTFKYFQYNFTIPPLSPLKEGRDPTIEQT